MRDVSSLHFSPTCDYSGGMGQLTLHRAAPVRRTLNQISRFIRKVSPRGLTWWTEISHPHEFDFDGNTYGRVFAEEGPRILLP